MGNKVRILAVFWIVGGSLLGHGEAATKNPQLAVFVTNSANAPERIVVAAEQNAGRILHQAGVNVHWVNCGAEAADPSEQCHDIANPGLVVRMIPHARTFEEEVFGVSFLNDDTGTYADLFLEPIERLHEQEKGITLAQILGDVLAHELGHLLLGSNAHSRDGIMQPHWTKEQLHRAGMGRMQFSKEQAAKMRTRIASFQIGHPSLPTLEAANR